MSQQNFLNESDIDALINLLLRSQQSRTREALCSSIGIDPNRLSFLRNSSDSDFFLLLIGYLNDIGDKEALCKLCCRELFPIFNKSTHRSILEEIAVKLNCNYDFGQNSPKNKPVEESTSPIHSSVPEFGVNYPNQLDESKPESWFTKLGNVNKKLLAGGAILLMGLAGFQIYYPIQKHYTKNIGYNSPYNDKAKFENSSEEDCIKRCLEEKGCVGVVISRDKQCWLKAHINFPLIVDPSATTIEIR